MGCGPSQNKNKAVTNKAETFPPKKETDGAKVKNAIEGKPELKEIIVQVSLSDGRKEKKTFPPSTFVDAVIKEAEGYLSENWTKQQLSLLYEGKNLRDHLSKKLEEISKGKTEIQIEAKLLGLPIAKDSIKEFSKTSFLGRPVYETHEFVFYDIPNQIVSVETNENVLKHFNHTSAYCNGADRLFISGGKSEANADKKLSASFAEIDLKSHAVSGNAVDLLNFPRKSHSMIYVPNNYVFIVGGKHCLQVEYYDLKEKKCFHHSDLNDERVEPALSLIDNSFLYSFTGFKSAKGNVNTFERINLRGKEKKWEKIEVKFESKVLSFSQMFFAISYFKNDSVIFLGGSDLENSKNNFAFNYNSNTIYKTESLRENFEFSEKFFIPIQKSTGLILPNFHERELKLLVWNNETLEKADFSI
jgi:hypothetical protein